VVADLPPPSSPAALSTTSSSISDDKERKNTRKVLLLLLETISFNKNTTMFLTPVTRSVAPDYHEYIKNPIDLSTIKKRIETGAIRSFSELESQIYLMFTNAFMFNGGDDIMFEMARDMFNNTVLELEKYKRTTEGEISCLQTLTYRTILSLEGLSV
jgi:hypothetical protein